MATFREDLKSFLAGDIASQISSLTLQEVYFGQFPKINRNSREAWCRYVTEAPSLRNTGRLDRHEVHIQLYVFGLDESEENNLAELLEDSAEELRNAYDEAEDVFRSGMSDQVVERVRLTRGIVDLDPERYERSITLFLTVDGWGN